ncbi:hypothetical protein APR11_001843 [Nocardia amikacinitolerans]|nr:hypothetical protein [Nocardia amikacinitolerans]
MSRPCSPRRGHRVAGMTTWELGEPVATRELRKGENSVTVVFGKPQQAEGGGYYCPVRVDGIEADPTTRAIFGMDSVQALIEAMSFAGRVLEATGEYTFEGGPDLGFPRG